MTSRYIEFATSESAQLVTDNAPDPGPGEVLIAVRHAGINRADLLQRLGLHPPPEDASPIPGLEVAGEVIMIGKDCTHLKEGDRVCALTHGGGYARGEGEEEEMIVFASRDPVLHLHLQYDYHLLPSLV